jgi:2-C-methyl-D-erythritol 4-phosphate cytidylyltransferase
MKRIAIIAAGGRGTRMESSLPKQFMKIHDEIILMRTLRIFHTFDPTIWQILVLGESLLDEWTALCKKEHFQIAHTITGGGKTRFHSVKNALELISKPAVVAIHDAVRPLVNQQTLDKVFMKAEEKGNAIPVADIHESIRKITPSINEALPREHYKLVQTPQAFKSELILKAYRQDYHPDFTDDASVVERLGNQIFTVNGNPENIKITTQKDLAVAETLMPYL